MLKSEDDWEDAPPSQEEGRLPRETEYMVGVTREEMKYEDKFQDEYYDREAYAFPEEGM